MKNNIFIAIIINIIITAFEVILGFISGSLALISDALHNFTDVGSMAFSWWGEKISQKPSNKFKTYGYKRAEIIIAFINSSILLAVIVFILVESMKRIFHPTAVAGFSMLMVAGIALVGNSIATYWLGKDKHKNLNMKSAWLHSLQDALFSLGVVAGALIIHYTGWFIVDSIISIFLSVYIIKEVIEIIKESIEVLMESVPANIDFNKVKNSLLDIKNILKIYDLHIWQLSSTDIALSVHVVIKDISDEDRLTILCSAKEMLSKEFNIQHSTIQLSTENENKQIAKFCVHCN